jgi:hypothetical protein
MNHRVLLHLLDLFHQQVVVMVDIMVVVDKMVPREDLVVELEAMVVLVEL